MNCNKLVKKSIVVVEEAWLRVCNSDKSSKQMEKERGDGAEEVDECERGEARFE